MLDGLWTVEFGSSVGLAGGGVVTLGGGKITGGDSGYYYLGDYAVSGQMFEAKLVMIPFIADSLSVFGTQGQSYTLLLFGQVNGDKATAQGQPEGMPQLRFGAKLIRRTQEIGKQA